MKSRFCLLVLVLGCSSHPAPGVQPTVPAKPSPVASEPEATPPELRLPADLARPTRQEVELTIDPASEDFSGRTAIELEVVKPTKLLWVNATEISVDHASIKTATGDVAATRITTKPGYLGLRFATEIPAGKATLAITYRGKATRSRGDGLYTLEERGDFYAYTQFENTDARKAFPCFDEPSYKVPWRLTIHTKKPLVALANTLPASETDEPNGMKKVVFGETKPMPSYLVAFAVGPFEMADAGKTKAGAPIRVIVPKGKLAETQYQVKNTQRIIDALEDYFGIPYPYPKLDFLGASVLNAGAMENPGLITFQEFLLAVKPEEMTRGRKEAFVSTAAHEVAHQWFGDMVTMAWWDDTWLNEAFASWMAAKIVEKIEPTWEGDVSHVSVRDDVMYEDSLDSARQIRQPILTADDIANAFDNITYNKGEAVLTMIERHIAPDVFQKGVRTYLQRHAWGNATYDDFVGAMTEVSGANQKPLFDSFVLQSGVPQVSVKLECPKGGAPKLVTTTHRYKPIGSKIDPKRTWTVPMCVKWGTGNKTGRDCSVVAGDIGEIPLSAKTCPDWVLPNEGEIGYYRTQLDGAQQTKLLAHLKQLPVAERDGVLGDIWSLVRSGDVSVEVFLALVPELARDPNRHLFGWATSVAWGMDAYVSDELAPNFERFVTKTFAARAHAIGWTGARDEDENTKRMRDQLLSIVAFHGHDKQLIAKATELTWKWLDDHKAVGPDLLDTAVGIATRFGDQKLFDRMHADAKKATDRTERSRLLRWMGGFYDPKLSDQAMAIALTDEFEPREAMTLIFGGFSNKKHRDTAYAFVKTHFDELAKRAPVPSRASLAYTFTPMCNTKMKQDIEAFFKHRIEGFEGGPRVYQQAMESLEICDAQKRSRTPGIEQFLKNQ